MRRNVGPYTFHRTMIVHVMQVESWKEGILEFHRAIELVSYFSKPKSTVNHRNQKTSTTYGSVKRDNVRIFFTAVTRGLHCRNQQTISVHLSSVFIGFFFFFLKKSRRASSQTFRFECNRAKSHRKKKKLLFFIRQ